jgi:hypothetical protein
MNQEQRDKIDRIKQHADRKIWVTFRKEGIHKYPAAATDPALATGDEYDVSFLGVPHRHIFHFRVWIDVFHNYAGGTLELNFKSCEMISDDLYLQIAQRYPDRAVWIEVAEDGENGALIKYEISRPSLSIVN